MHKRSLVALTLLTIVLAAVLLPSTVSAQTDTTSKQAFGHINLSAGLIYNNGDVKPAARIGVAVLDGRAKAFLDSAWANILEKTPPKKQKHLKAFADNDPMRSALNVFYGMLDESSYDKTSAETSDRWRVRLLRTSIRWGTTGFDGKVVLDSIPPGSYFVFAEITTTHTSAFAGRVMTLDDPHFWFVPITVVVGAQELVLDNDSLW